MKCKLQAGLTLIEIMIAVAILAIISAIAIPVYQGYLTEARYGTAMKDIRQVQLILDDLAGDNNLAALDGDVETDLGVYMDPTGTVILGAPASTPAGTEPWLDPWGRIYRYRRPDEDSQDYLLFSQGPDAADASDDAAKE
jgi:prepilin-type N-terminal cleavage/methylation domain-containing protein